MYKVLELYPLKNKKRIEYPIKTDSYYSRMGSIEWKSTRTKTLNYTPTPTLDEYLSLGEIHHWDLTRDINYIYANVIYPPQAIKWHILRLFEFKHSYTACLMSIGFYIDRSLDRVQESARYGGRRTLQTYAKIMFYLSKEEKAKGYPHALDFEA